MKKEQYVHQTPQQLASASSELLEQARRCGPARFSEEIKVLEKALNDYYCAPWEFLKEVYLRDAHVDSFRNIDRYFREAIHTGEYSRYMDRSFDSLKKAFETLARKFEAL